MSNQQRKIAYIAGPMSGLPEYNRPAFNTEANRQHDHLPLNLAPFQLEHMACYLPMVMLAGELTNLCQGVVSSRLIPRGAPSSTGLIYIARPCGRYRRSVIQDIRA
ncbi:DUF4406 domain-containing protein [Aeromonas enteropelogenes]|uniref:DUF4406 domain-containing protein n=1 Tax=Aeromonas enteropelogenes TaxID=29489 RepID=UPI003B9EF8D3